MDGKKAVLFCAFAAQITLALLSSPHTTAAQQDSAFADQIHAIASRPEYKHSTFGVAVYSLDDEKVVFELHGEELFTPGSTTKLLTEGTALELLGADFRFHTRVYRTGPITANGVLKGNLILAASGDPNLSGRIQPDGTLAFENVDHSYDGSPDTKAVPGDPLLVIRELAAQVAAHGVKQIDGRVLVDAGLFPEGDRELGTSVVVSPISLNDNVVDLTVSPGSKENSPVGLNISPPGPYVSFVNKITTGSANSKPDVKPSTDVTNADGSHTVTLTGKFPLGSPSILYTYPVPEPSRFAQMTFVQALRDKGIKAEIPAPAEKVDLTAFSSNYTKDNVVAEHVSAPLSEEIKVTLKVSQNLHATMMPSILGAIVGHKTQDIDQGGFDLEHDFLAKAGLDLSGASQGDGAGGAQSAYYTPDFMVHYLAFMSKQKDFALFETALPILGRDGTLWYIQADSPAAGYVFAKTGTYGSYDALNKNLMLNGKGLAGYMTTADGKHLAFAAFVNRVPISMDDPEAAQKIAGQALGEIAGAIYSTSAGKTAAVDAVTGSKQF